MPNQSKITKNLDRILKIAQKYNPRIIGVTKYYDANTMVEAYKAGISDFGESRVNESIEKIISIDDEIRSNSVYHFIGHLQTNKVKRAVGFFEYIHCVDSLKLALEISKQASDKGIIQKILIQVNNADEEQKFGISPQKLGSLLEQISELKAIETAGLMNIAPNTDDQHKLKKLFAHMRSLKEEYGLKELSMGMSNDFETALDEGATMIRLGRILFE